MSLKHPQEIQLTITSVNAHGLGCAQIDDQQFRVPFVLPGEKVRVLTVRKSKGWTLCKLLEVIESSPKRRPPPCPHFGICGGCDLQHLAYEEQLRLKQAWLKQVFEFFKQWGDVSLRDIIPSPCEYHYRNRVTLHHNSKAWGYHQADSNEIIPIDECPIASEALNAKLQALPACVLTGPNDFEVREDGHAGFVQVNGAQNAALIAAVLGAAQGRKWKQVLDLYCGAGNFTFPLSDIAGRVLAYDADPSVIAQAEEMRIAKENKKIRFEAGDAVSVVSEFAHDYQQFDLIVCDPPRVGLGSAASYLPRLKPQKIIYVSCSVQSFLDDAQVLFDGGYQLAAVTPVDMFPQTHHIEIVGEFGGR